ncbi:hypothetical protein RP20_CCG010353 [Aedes albopictus]|nr:hypothetical protein RP20_CCG010353 [Aedes albopictus]
MTPSSVIEVCKRHFSCHGTPQLVVTDNGSNFVNEQMKIFAKSWGFKHSTSAPYHQQSNGKAEAAVKIAKDLLQKSQESGQDFWYMLQHWRNTPNKIGSSPASRLLSRSIRCGIPIPATNLIPKVVQSVPESILRNRRKIEYQYDKRSRELPQIEIGSPVYVQLRPDTSKLWTPGVVCDRLSDRSYLIGVEGTKYRRDAVHVKPRKESTAPLISEQPIPNGYPDRRPEANMQPTVHAASQECHQPTVPLVIPNQEAAEFIPPTSVELPTLTEPRLRDPVDPDPPVKRTEKSKTPITSTDRPKRESRLPSRFKDYVVFK